MSWEPSHSSSWGPTPERVPGLEDVVSLAVSESSASLALKRDGTVWAWGANILGALGDGTYENHLTPVQVPGIDDAVFLTANWYNAAGMLMAGVALGRSPAAAESRATAESRALGAEARASVVEAGAEGARVGALVSAETLGLSRALSAEEASALEARLLELEAESPGKREAFSGEELREGRLKAPVRPVELTEEDSLWDEFEAYRQRRFREVLEQWRGGKRPLSVKPPLRWEPYQELREHFQRSHDFETKVGGVLSRESEESAGSRGVLKESRQPLIARHVGTTKSGQAGVRYPDYLVVDETTLKEGSAPRVDSISVKQRNFMNKSRAEVVHQVEIDAQEAVNKYRSTGLSTRRKEIERYNLYRPPPVTEWRPAHEIQSDVEEPAKKVEFYEVQAESLIALLHTQLPSVLSQEPHSVVEVDDYVSRERWAEFLEHMPEKKRIRLMPMLGSYLGELLIKHLGGHWVPRRSLLETAVVVGPRAWLPFLRAHHLLQSPGTAQRESLDFTLSQFFHQAVRHASH